MGNWRKGFKYWPSQYWVKQALVYNSVGDTSILLKIFVYIGMTSWFQHTCIAEMTIERLQELKLGSMSCSNPRPLLARTMLYLHDLKKHTTLVVLKD
jgi:hypothetical protein